VRRQLYLQRSLSGTDMEISCSMNQPVTSANADCQHPYCLVLVVGSVVHHCGTSFLTQSLGQIRLLTFALQAFGQAGMRNMLVFMAALQAFLTHLLTVDLPKLMVLPKRLEINIPPAVTAVAEAAVGRDVVMRAVASAVLQADALENALIAALPLGPQSAAGGVSLPDSFQGELQVCPLSVCKR